MNNIEKKEWFQIENNLSDAEMEFLKILERLGRKDFSGEIKFPNAETKILKL